MKCCALYADMCYILIYILCRMISGRETDHRLKWVAGYKAALFSSFSPPYSPCPPLSVFTVCW